MANFNSNQWYRLTVASDSGQSFLGSNLYDKGLTGTVFFNTTTPSAPRQRWQIFRVAGDGSNTTWTLRTGEGGPNAYLSTRIGTNSGNSRDNVGNTVPTMVNASILSLDEASWGISGWGDGTFYLYNIANGTDWHLEEGGRQAFMSNNISIPRDPQRWSFVPIINATIDNPKFSKIATFSSPTSTSSTSQTSSSTTATTTNPSSSSTSSSSSKGRTIGIAVGVTLGVLILLLLGALFFLRRTKQRRRAKEQSYASAPTASPDGLPTENVIYKYEKPTPQELPSTSVVPAELHSERDNAAVELPGHEVPRDGI